MLRLHRVWILGALLFLSACSSTFVYNRLDFLLPWYLDDYAELNREQETYLDELLSPFLAWHRKQELPSYVSILGGIEDSLSRPLTPAAVAAIFDEFQTAWFRLEGESLEWLLNLGAQLSDEQIAGFLEVLWEQQEEFEEEYLERSEEEFYQDSYDNLLDSSQDYLGTVSEKQRELLRQSSRGLLRSDKAWLQERAGWFTQLGVLLEREPQWQLRVREAVVARRKTISPEYLRIYEHNMGIIYGIVAQLLNERSEQQDRHLRKKLSELREDLEILIAQGKDRAGTPSG